MKKDEVLLNQAKKILTQERLSTAPRANINAQTSKRLRKFFISTCMAEIGNPFTSRIAGLLVK